MDTYPEHVLYKTGDPDAPSQIKDRNGEVALRLCRGCGRGEIELEEPCIMPYNFRGDGNERENKVS